MAAAAVLTVASVHSRLAALLCMLQPVATGSCNRFLQPVATGPCNRSLQRSTTGCNRFLQQAATQESPSVASTVRSVHSRSRGLRSGTATHCAIRGDLFANRMHAVARCHGAFGTHLVCLLCAVCVCFRVFPCVCDIAEVLGACVETSSRSHAAHPRATVVTLSVCGSPCRSTHARTSRRCSG